MSQELELNELFCILGARALQRAGLGFPSTLEEIAAFKAAHPLSKDEKAQARPLAERLVDKAMAIVANAADQRPTRGWSSFVSEHDVLDASELRNAAGKGRTPALAADLEKEPDRLTDGETTSVQNILNCWEFLGCDGQRRANCPAYQKGKGKSCWLAAGSYCSDLKAAYGRDHVKTHCCDDCRYYQDRHKQVLKGVACP